MTPTTVIPSTATQPARAMSPTRKLAITTGVLFFITHVTSVAAIVLYQPVLNHPGYVLGNGAANSRILLGGLLEVILAAAVIGTAVTLYPVVSRHNRALAIGYVGLRTLEAGIIVTGIVSLLAVVSLQHEAAGTAASAVALTTVGKALVAVPTEGGLSPRIVAIAWHRDRLRTCTAGLFIDLAMEVAATVESYHIAHLPCPYRVSS